MNNTHSLSNSPNDTKHSDQYQEHTDAVLLRLVPKDEPNSTLLMELVDLFRQAALQAGGIAPTEPLDPVPDDQGIQLRAILDQKKEEIRERAAKAEPRATELKKRLEEHGPDANAAEVAEARRKLIDAVIRLKEQFGIVISAHTE
jgi:hypothetical protein